MAEETNRAEDRLYPDWQAQFAANSDQELIEALNREVGSSGWVSARSYYLPHLREEIDRRGFDLADVDGLSTYPGKRRFTLSAKTLRFEVGGTT